ncbi:MAG TPA: T9SS type A sorting domain-containing protein [Bacteroidia bacterium]|nr:T9SS type A sorting domain-containing protein [Bacteroidia bacterium]HQK98393.1 T9SS type A sorting domain-containing protein [Bacteroidia bacterium]
MRFITFLFLSVIFSTLNAQPYQIGHTTISLIDSSRANRSIPTEVYYPADIAGNNVPVTTLNTTKFPLLSFGHGFVMTWDAYQNIWEAVVPHGFIIAFPKTETGLSPSHSEFGKDLAFVIAQLNRLNHSSASAFYNRIDSMNCVMGHSMGGGAAFLAAGLDSTIKTLATLAPAETNPSAINTASNISLPSLIMAGGNDCVTPPVTNQIPMYDSLQSNCKSFISIIGGSHCQMAENNFLCSFGEATCTPQPTITRGDQHIVINRYLIPWLNYQLKGDCLAGIQFDSLITTDASINYQKSCVLCSTSTAVNELNNTNVEVYPNPFLDKIEIRLSSTGFNSVKISLSMLNGTKVYSDAFENVKPNESLFINSLSHLTNGMYLLKIDIGNGAIFRKLVKY